MIRVSPQIPGGKFLSALGGAYEYEADHTIATLVDRATTLRAALEEPDHPNTPAIAKFLAQLVPLLEFLNGSSETSVRLYSYDRRPSVNDLLDAFAEGAGGDDWALDEIAKTGDKGRRELIKVLKNNSSSDRHLSAVSMLLIVFSGAATTKAIEEFIGTAEQTAGIQAAQLIAAYRDGRAS